MGMFGSNVAVPSLADIAAVTRNNNGDGFGDGNGWWVLIILFALFGGWGNGGYAGNGGNYGTQAEVQRGFDTQAIISKLDGINSGICSLGYDQLAQMNGINSNVSQTGNNIIQAINADTVANMQNANALSRQFADCCCENRAAIADLKYDLSTDFCALNNNVHQTGDAIINSQNQGFMMLNNTINERFTRLEMAQKDQLIADLQLRLNNCDRDNALQGTANYIINQVRPTAIPSYNVPNPNCCYPTNNQCDCGNNFGCCNR